MKIIFLNVWNAKMREPLADFIREQARDTDVFCLQEVYGRARRLLGGLLPGYRRATALKYVTLRDPFAQATYVRAGLEAGEPAALCERQPRRCGLGICTPVRLGRATVSIVNVHGLAQPGDKRDNPERLAQSRGIIEFCAALPGPKIIGGDFNLMPDTESLRMFAKNGYRDLVADFKVPTTRNRLAWVNYPGKEQYYSDYVFASPELKIKTFAVPRNEISDHLPLIIEIEH
jgi:endonuclease/exonuclease/phosphatase family metal-dependent hydrolase